MPSLSEMCWTSDIEAALLNLTRDKIKAPEYHWSTVDRVEAGTSPATNQKITMSELEVWVTRCKTPPTQTEEATANADHKTRRVSPSN